MEVSVTQIKAKFTAIAKLADSGIDVIITRRGKPAYRLLPIVKVQNRTPFPDVTALALQSKPCLGLRNAGRVDEGGNSFVPAWRAQSERF